MELFWYFMAPVGKESRSETFWFSPLSDLFGAGFDSTNGKVEAICI